MPESELLHVEALPSKDPSPPSAGSYPAHWVGNPPTHFQNPWPSFGKDNGFLDILQTRFGSKRNFVPVPRTREELVKVRKPDWGRNLTNSSSGVKATWLGHAGVLVETAASVGAQGLPTEATRSSSSSREGTRGLRILFDAVFSERTSPVTWFGPKRYTPIPCSVDELPEIDVIVTSHDHYDHMDLITIRQICERQHATGKRVHFFAGLDNARHFLAAGAGIRSDEITECDWWDTNEISLSGVGALELTCTPTQHSSGRGLFDRGQSLWCSWAIVDKFSKKQLFFAGDTAYKSVDAPSECPIFKQIGSIFNGFDLAFIPIGLYSPQSFMSAVHVCPEDSFNIHKDVRSRMSIGMHYGTVRGGVSAQYEDVREPPKRWREAAEKEGKWGRECALCDVGETVMV